MIRTILFSTMLIASASVQSVLAQDVITKKSGDDIQAKVEEITETSVKYKKWSNPNGPTYTVSKSEIFRIKYQNGDVDMFKDAAPAAATQEQPAASKGPTLVNKAPDAHNAEIIARYSGKHDVIGKFSEKDKQKPAQSGVAFMRFDESSVLSTEDLEISFKVDESIHPDKTVWGLKLFGKETSKRCVYFRYDIMLTNKTDHIIYIDLANTMRESSIGESYSYYNADQVSSSVGHGTASGIGIAAAGLAVGTGRSSNATATHNFVSQQVISIPPHAKKQLSQFKYASSKNSTSTNWGAYETPERAEEFNFTDVPIQYMIQALCIERKDLGLKQGIVNIGTEKTFTLADTPYSARYNIVYSSDQDFKTYSMLTPVLYIYKIEGIERMPWLDQWTTEKWIVSTISDYDQNTIIAPLSFGKNFKK